MHRQGEVVEGSSDGKVSNFGESGDKKQIK